MRYLDVLNNGFVPAFENHSRSDVACNDGCMNERLSASPRGRRWVSNFDPAHRADATRLLDSLRIETWSHMRENLRTSLSNLLLNGEIASPAILIPVMGLKELGPLPPGKKFHVAWETFLPGQPIASISGSEAPIGNMVRELTGERPGQGKGGWLHPLSTLDDLKNLKCRSVVLVTDYAGTGNQVAEFAKTFVRNKHLRSWRSGGFIRIHIVSYASAVEHLPTTAVDHFWPITPSDTFASAAWTDEQRKNIEGVCRTYTPSAKRKIALGYQMSGGLFTSDISVPNNLPYVFIRPAGKMHHWHPLFGNRIFESDILPSGQVHHTPTRRHGELAMQAGRARIARAIAGSPSGRTHEMHLVLLAALSGSRGNFQLSLASGLTGDKVQEWLNFLNTNTFLSPTGAVTATGMAELRAAGRRARHSSADLVGDDSVYYPQSLR